MSLFLSSFLPSTMIVLNVLIWEVETTVAGNLDIRFPAKVVATSYKEWSSVYVISIESIDAHALMRMPFLLKQCSMQPRVLCASHLPNNVLYEYLFNNALYHPQIIHACLTVNSHFVACEHFVGFSLCQCRLPQFFFHEIKDFLVLLINVIQFPF